VFLFVYFFTFYSIGVLYHRLDVLSTTLCAYCTAFWRKKRVYFCPRKILQIKLNFIYGSTTIGF